MLKKLLNKVIAAWIVAVGCVAFLLSDYAYAGSMNGGGTIPANLPVFKFNRSSQYNLKQIRPGIFQAKQDNIAPRTIKPSELENVTYRLKNNVEIIPDGAVLKSSQGATRVYLINGDNFELKKGKIYADMKNKSIFRVEEVEKMNLVETVVNTNMVSLEDVLEDVEVPFQDVALNSANIPATAVAPYIKVNHGAKPDPLQLKSIMQNFPKGNLPVPKDIPKLNLSVQNNNTININKTLSNNMSNDTQSVKFLSANNPVDVNAGVGYVEVEFRDMDLGQYIESQGVKTKDGSYVSLKISGKVGLYAPTIRPYYKFGKKLGAEFLAGESIKLDIKGNMKLAEELRIPLFGFNINIINIGEIGAGVFLKIGFNGQVQLEFSLDQALKYSAGAEIGFKWGIIPTGVKTYSNFEKKLKTDFSINMQGQITTAIGPELYLSLFGFDLLNLHIYVGGSINASIISGAAAGSDGTDKVDMNIYAYADIGGRVVGKGFSILNEKWFLAQKKRAYTGSFKISIDEADAYLGTVRGRIKYTSPSAKGETVPYTGNIKLQVVKANGTETPYINAYCSNGEFNAKDINMYKGDRVKVVLLYNDLSGSVKSEIDEKEFVGTEKRILSQPIYCAIHFNTINISADCFNDEIAASVPGYIEKATGNEINYTGPINLKIDRYANSSAVPVVNVNAYAQMGVKGDKSVLDKAPVLFSGEVLGQNNYIPYTNLFKMINGKYTCKMSLRPRDLVNITIDIKGFKLSGMCQPEIPLKVNAQYMLKTEIYYNGFKAPANINKYRVTRYIKGVITNTKGTKQYTGAVDIISARWLCTFDEIPYTADKNYFINDCGYLVKEDVKVEPIYGTASSSFEAVTVKEFTPKEFEKVYSDAKVDDFGEVLYNFEGELNYDKYFFSRNPVWDSITRKQKIYTELDIYKKIVESSDGKINPDPIDNITDSIVNGLYDRGVESIDDLNVNDNVSSLNSIMTFKNLSQIGTRTKAVNYSVNVTTQLNQTKSQKTMYANGSQFKVKTSIGGMDVYITNNLSQNKIQVNNIGTNKTFNIDKQSAGLLIPTSIVKLRDASVDGKQCSVYQYVFNDKKVTVYVWNEKGVPLQVNGYDINGKQQYQVKYSNYCF